MAVGELFLTAFLQVLFDKLASRELLNFAHREGIRKKLEKWARTLSTIQAVLNDAEDKQLTSKAVQLWLDDLRDLAYDAEDILDEFATEALRRELKAEHHASTSQVWNPFPTRFSSWSPSATTFKFRMGSKIDEITSRLQVISDQRLQLGLKDITGGTSNNIVWQRPPSTSLPSEPCVYGRDEDKKKILELLLRDEQGDAKVSVIPIVGMGGVGKTTLTQLVYNDNALQHFTTKVWVCVSDEFDVMKITRSILESVTSQPCDLKDLNQIQVKLYEALTGKKYLLVLDDVWNENYGKWNALRPPFQAGAPESKIIVTTRNIDVALMMGTVEYHYLKHLSDDDCWSAFVQHAFENKDICEHPNLDTIGRKIVKKCRGLPLAVRTMGGLLRCKQSKEEWENILNSKIWSLSDRKSDILPVLRLSYHHLPSQLKRCFAYCSILPKDYEFEENELVLLWMAEGLIEQPEDNKLTEELGSEYFRELVSRTFFQQSRRNKSCFVMHDLISDLAQFVAGEICFRLEDYLDSNKHSKISTKALHSSYIGEHFDGVKKFEPFHAVKRLRTFLPLMLPSPGRCYLTSHVPVHLLPKFPCLRVLSLNGYRISELPDSIGDLIHLRYLDLSRTRIRSLPESTSKLFNLQTLVLENCYELKKLPADIGNLINLRHLNNFGVPLLEGMLLRIGTLTDLQTLPNFVVGNCSGSGIGELGPLLHLQGTLCISRLENVTEPGDARVANLNGKHDLDVLSMEWGCETETGDLRNRNFELELEVLEMLQPHKKLKELIISGYCGQRFPSWVGDGSFSNMVLLSLKNCGKCTSLPPLGQLHSLKNLWIKGMTGVNSVGPELYGESSSKPFPSLETLHFEDMEEWKDWVPSSLHQEIELFPCLRELSVERCPKLLGQLPDHLPSLEKLVISYCEQLVVSIPSLQILSKLKINGCKEVVHSSRVNLRSLNSLFLGEEEDQEQQQVGMSCRLEFLEIRNCERLEKLPGVLHNLTSLRELTIEDCPSLVSFPDTGLPSTVRVLKIKNCNSLESLHEALMHNGACFEWLFVERCNSLKSIGRSQILPTLPETGLLSIVRVMEINNCNSLESLHETLMQKGVCLEQLYIDGCTSLKSITRGQLPPSLKALHICNCNDLQCLVEDGGGSSLVTHNVDTISHLEHLFINECRSLRSLSSGGELPAALKRLHIYDCSKLESIAENLHSNTSLESINIVNCQNLKSLPEGLYKLTHLHRIRIAMCRSLISFPHDWLLTHNLRNLNISNCEKLEASLNHLHKLTFLQQLCIFRCPGIVSFPELGFPTNLTSLLIDLNISKPLSKLGLQRLCSLRHLSLIGACQLDVVSFPWEENMMLPSSLTSLMIMDFPNLKWLSSKGFQNLTSLEVLCFSGCPNLKYFPKEGLPPLILRLQINHCPLLKQRCRKGKGQYWPMIAHIPCIEID